MTLGKSIFGNPFFGQKMDWTRDTRTSAFYDLGQNDGPTITSCSHLFDFCQKTSFNRTKWNWTYFTRKLKRKSSSIFQKMKPLATYWNAFWSLLKKRGAVWLFVPVRKGTYNKNWDIFHHQKPFVQVSLYYLRKGLFSHNFSVKQQSNVQRFIHHGVF